MLYVGGRSPFFRDTSPPERDQLGAVVGSRRSNISRSVNLLIFLTVRETLTSLVRFKLGLGLDGIRQVSVRHSIRKNVEVRRSGVYERLEGKRRAKNDPVSSTLLYHAPTVVYQHGWARLKKPKVRAGNMEWKWMPWSLS